jgi:hypothetical protein
VGEGTGEAGDVVDVLLVAGKRDMRSLVKRFYRILWPKTTKDFISLKIKNMKLSAL